MMDDYLVTGEGPKKSIFRGDKSVYYRIGVNKFGDKRFIGMRVGGRQTLSEMLMEVYGHICDECGENSIHGLYTLPYDVVGRIALPQSFVGETYIYTCKECVEYYYPEFEWSNAAESI